MDGHTKTTVNYAIATFEALKKTAQIRVTEDQRNRLKIVSGPVSVHVAITNMDRAKPAEPAAPKEQ